MEEEEGKETINRASTIEAQVSLLLTAGDAKRAPRAHAVLPHSKVSLCDTAAPFRDRRRRLFRLQKMYKQLEPRVQKL